jgi:hypothetical protein
MKVAAFAVAQAARVGGVKMMVSAPIQLRWAA